MLLSNYQAYYNEAWTIRPLEVQDANPEDEVTVWYDWGDGTAMTMGDPDDNYAATHTYAATGTFTMTVYADDGEGHNISKTASVAVKERNRQASVERIILSPDKEEYSVDETITFTVTVTDLEGDNVTVTIEYGDGDSDEKVVDLEPKVDTNVTFEHAYSEADDEYEVSAIADDGLTHATEPVPEVITIVVKADAFPWAYAALGVIALLAAIVAAAMLMKRRKKGPTDLIPEDSGGMEGMAPPEEENPPPSE